MFVEGKHYRTIWVDQPASGAVNIIDQTKLPHRFEVQCLSSVEQLVTAIKQMQIRGAPALGAAGAFGVWLAARQAASEESLYGLTRLISAARPTAVNLAWGVSETCAVLKTVPFSKWSGVALDKAQAIADQDAAGCQKIGEFGFELLAQRASKSSARPLQIMTHCNAGWLACVDFGTATAPIYHAKKQGLNIHVWVSETRPRNQGSQLTAWELSQEGVAHTVVSDNACGLLMQRGEVDLVLVGSDRTTAHGDVANKIGTYLKALSAKAHQIPFYVALPSSTIDFKMTDGIEQIPIEERSAEELLFADGILQGRPARVAIANQSSPVFNPAFDVTPRDLVTALITERGVCPATEQGIKALFADRV